MLVNSIKNVVATLELYSEMEKSDAKARFPSQS